MPHLLKPSRVQNITFNKVSKREILPPMRGIGILPMIGRSRCRFQYNSTVSITRHF
jgi:hypothetical protein